VARLGTGFVVAAIGLLGLVAAIDAFRSDEVAAPAADTTARTEAERTAPEDTDTAGPQDELRRLAARVLAEEHVEGALVVTDLDCRVRRLALPSLEEEAPPIANGCRLVVSPGSQAVGADGTVPGPEITAECTDTGVIARPRGRTVFVPAVCPPAWTPDGRLTVVVRGELRQVRLDCAPGEAGCTTPLIGRADLARALGGLPWEMGRPSVREAAWLSNDRVALVVHDGAQELDAIAVFRGRELLGSPPFLYESLSDLRTSPRGGYAAALLNRRALVLIDGRGEYQPLSFRGASGIAWSPDERWTATATGDGLFLFGTGTRGVNSVFVPGEATDVAWIAPK